MCVEDEEFWSEAAALKLTVLTCHAQHLWSVSKNVQTPLTGYSQKAEVTQLQSQLS